MQRPPGVHRLGARVAGLGPPVAEPVGLLAGWGRFPILFAEKARRLGIPVVCVGIRHEASAELAELVDRFYWCGLVRLGRMIRCFRREGVKQVVMAGKIHKAVMFTPMWVLRLLPGWRLTVSTALTYDLNGRCVEGAGIPVDVPVAPDRSAPDADDVVLRRADEW